MEDLLKTLHRMNVACQKPTLEITELSGGSAHPNNTIAMIIDTFLGKDGSVGSKTK